MNSYFKTIRYGEHSDLIFWIAQSLPLIIWFILIKKFYYDTTLHKINPYINYLLILPIIGIGLNIYLTTIDTIPTPPRTWDFCLDTNISQEQKRKGIVGFYNYKCYHQQYSNSLSVVTTYIDRLYYINYILFFIILIVQNNYVIKMIGRNKKIHSAFVNLLGISSILGVIGSIIPLFLGVPIWTYLILRFLSSILWMSSTILIIFLIHLFLFVNKGWRI